jgi:hypothetical protein
VNLSDWIAVAGLLLGGGGAQLVAKLTRLAVAVENLVKSNEKLVGQVDDHEKRLNKGGL